MKSLPVLFVAMAFVAGGEAIHCYDCDSPPSQCDGPVDTWDLSVSVTMCPEGYDLCYKSSGELSNLNGTVRRTERGCANQRLTPLGNKFPYPLNSPSADNSRIVTLSIQFCDTYLCNGVSASSAVHSMLIVLAVPLVFGNYY